MWGLTRLILSTYKPDDIAALLLSHLEMVAEDAIQYKWDSVRTFSNECFDKADRKEMTSRSDAKIREQRIKKWWISGPKPSAQATPCHSFNLDNCDEEDGHEQGGVKAQHRCAVCWFAVGLKECTHPAKLCNRRSNLNQRHSNRTYGQGGYKHNGYQKNKPAQASGPESGPKERSYVKN